MKNIGNILLLDNTQKKKKQKERMNQSNVAESAQHRVSQVYFLLNK